MATNSRSKKDEKAVALEAPPTKAKGGRLNNGKAKKAPAGAKTSSSSGSSGRSRKSATASDGGATNLVVVESPPRPGP